MRNEQEWMTGIIIAGIVLLVMFLICMAVCALFLHSINKLQDRIQESNRQISKGMVWLNLVPFLGLGWAFYVVVKLRDSIDFEYESRGLSPRSDNYGFGLGLTYSILAIGFWLPYIGFLIGVPFLVFFILYWVKLVSIRKELEQTEKGVQHGSDDDDFAPKNPDSANPYEAGS